MLRGLTNLDARAQPVSRAELAMVMEDLYIQATSDTGIGGQTPG